MATIYTCSVSGIRFSVGDTVYIEDPLSPVIPEVIPVEVKQQLVNIMLVDKYGTIHRKQPFKLNLTVDDLDLVQPPGENK